MFKQLFPFLLAALFITFISCKDNGGPEGPEFEEIITTARAFDAGNLDSFGDIYVKIEFPLDRDYDEIRLVLVPEALDESFDIDDALALNEDSYISIDPSMRTYTGNLDPDLKDVNGDRAELNTNYIIRFILLSGMGNFISTELATITLTDEHPLIGRYRGLWNDNFYTDFPVTMIVSGTSNGVLQGEFFYTPSFSPCCNAAAQGAENDGTISMETNQETNTITRFTYNQVLLTFMGGCNGTYHGDGNYSATTISISFEGNDCEGFHENGNISLDRLF